MEIEVLRDILSGDSDYLYLEDSYKDSIVKYNYRGKISEEQMQKALHNPLFKWKFSSKILKPEAFVQPKLRRDGTVMRQTVTTGMLVQVKNDFIGVVLGKEENGSRTYVRILGGLQESPTFFKLVGWEEYRIDTYYFSGWRRELLKTYASGIVILDPKKVPAIWYEYAKKLQKNILNLTKEKVWENLQNKLAKPNFDRIKDFRKSSLNVRNRNEKWKKQLDLAKNVNKGFKVINTSIEACFGDLSLLSIPRGKICDTNLILEYWNRERALQLTNNQCGHISVKSYDQIAYDTYLEETTICSCCANDRNKYGDALNRDGNSVKVSINAQLYIWSDGTKRISQEPCLITEYHGSKKKFGLLPRMDGQPFVGLNLGFELEMERSPKTTMNKEELARLINARVLSARPNTWSKEEKGYAFYERDGSIDDGFEMATSYGDLAVHRYHVFKVFGGERLPFLGKLRSHDASSSCGLHVHMTKPSTLQHAVKLQAFFNDPINQRLIRAVSRRFNGRYASVQTEKTINEAKNTTVRTYANTYSYNKTSQRVTDSIFALSTERYNMVNYKPTHTVEIRCFRGTMIPNTIMACLELSHAAWYFSRDNKVEDLTTEKFLVWIAKPENCKDTASLRAYLAIKGFNVVNKSNPRVAIPFNEENCEEA